MDSRNEPAGRYATVNGLRMYYEIHGSGKPLVLIHGGGSTIQTTFGRILPLLSGTHKVIAVEMQAHGHTADIDRSLSFEQDADDIAALLKQLHIDKADIFGFSNGASTTLQFAIRHPQMTGRIVVMKADGFARWLAAQPQGDGLAKTGETVFRARGCSGCHSKASKVHAPDLNGLYGRKVQLADGRTVTADEAYLRDSMLKPRQDVAAGFEPIMPSYAGILTDGEIISLTAYIRSLSGKEENRQ